VHRLILNSRRELIDDEHLTLLRDREAVARTILGFLREDLLAYAVDLANGQASEVCAE
jgi:hypothetical protein